MLHKIVALSAVATLVARAEEAEVEEEVDDFVDPDDEDDDDDIDFSDIEEEMKAEAMLDQDWDKDMTPEWRRERFNMCLHATRNSFQRGHPHMEEVISNVRASGGSEQEAVNHFLFTMLTVCYKQLPEETAELIRKGEALSEEARMVMFQRKEDTPLQLNKDQNTMLSEVLTDDQERQQAAMSPPMGDHNSGFWYLYLLGMWAILFSIGAAIVWHLMKVEANSPKNFKAGKENRMGGRGKRIKAA